MEFEWDPKKSEMNWKKHGVSFHDAATVFADPLAITFPDPEHSLGEHRLLTFGHSNMNHLLVVSHTDRNNKTRIISARRATKNERAIYENG
jgi:uncharacterized DUF497 family protein